MRKAWAEHQVKQQQRPVDQSRHRTTASRAAATAADTAIAATQVEHRSALSLNTVSNQPASQPARGPSPSRIAQIIGHTNSKYKVVHSQPAGNPEKGDVGRAWLEKQADYAELVLAYWGEQQSDSAEEATFGPQQRQSKPRRQIEEEEEEEEEEAEQHEMGAQEEETAADDMEDEEPAENDDVMEDTEQ